MRRYHRLFRPIIIAAVAATLFAGTVFAATLSSKTDGESGATSSNKVELTAEEQEFQDANPTIIVAGDASWRPLEYRDDDTGEYAGVIAQITKKLEEYTGFHIEYKVMDSYSEALEAVQNGEADISSGVADDTSMANSYNMVLSQPFLEINSAIVSKKDITGLYTGGDAKTIAVVTGDYANDAIRKNIKNADLIECDSNETCLDKVKNDEVDMAIIATYCAEYYMSIPKYSSLKSHTISDFAWNLSFGINKTKDPMLVSILNKGIAKMGNTDINEAVYDGVVNAAYDNNLMIFVYQHPFIVIAVILGIVLIIGGLLFIIYINRKRERERQIEDGVRLRLALERTRLCIWEIDLATKKITKVNNEHERHGFYQLRDNVPESIIEAGYVHPEDVSLVRDMLGKVYQGEQNIQGSWRIKDQDVTGDHTVYWWEQVLFHVVFDEHHKPVKAIGVSEDITKEKNAQRDSLTSVYNRNSFEKKANHILQERRNAYLQCAFLILDLDGFKLINDNYGHAMGDKVLISVGAALNKTFRSTDIVGRLGGDEFTAFMTSIGKPEDAMKKAQELVENVSKIQEREGYEFAVSCSVGVVVATKGQEDFAALYKKADTALYDAKHAGKNQFCMYEEKSE